MVTVAVAGGTGAVGRTIVKALVESQNHNVFVLSRSSGASTENVQYLALDYSNVDKITSVLREHNISVIVSALVLFDANAANAQINLIRGAAQSTTVTKFVPSEYHLDFNVPIDGIELFCKKFNLEAVEELKRHPQLTWSVVRNGLFLDYLGMPYQPKPTQLEPWSVFVDLDHEICVFPENGSQTMIFTHSTDLAAYLERLIDLPAADWPRDSLIMPNKLHLNEIPGMLKKITGRDFKVIYDSAKTIRAGHITQLPSNKVLFADATWGEVYQTVEREAMFTVLSNGYDLRGTNLATIFPDVRTSDITDFLAQSWALKTG